MRGIELWWRTSFFHDSISCHHTAQGGAQVRATTMLRAQLIDGLICSFAPPTTGTQARSHAIGSPMPERAPCGGSPGTAAYSGLRRAISGAVAPSQPSAPLEMPTGYIMMAATASSFAASCGLLTCVAVLHSTEKSARRNSRPVSKRSHEKARKAAELTIGKTKKLRVSSHGSAANSPANLPFGPRPQHERRTKPSTTAPAITSGASIVVASCCWYVPMPMHCSGNPRPVMLILSTSKTASKFATACV